MKVQKAVLKETGHIAIGVLIADVIMCIVFALLKKFDYTVVLGALLGTGIAVANFFFLGVTLQKAVGMQEFASKYVRQTETAAACINRCPVPHHRAPAAKTPHPQ